MGSILQLQKNRMRFVIWGAGDRGNRIFQHLEYVVAFIDENEALVGTQYHGIPVISFQIYLEQYYDCYIVISTHEEEVEPFLKKQGVFRYYLMSECPEDLQTANPRTVLKESFISEIHGNHTYWIYGDTLYAVLLLEWIKQQQTTACVRWYPGSMCNAEKKQDLADIYHDVLMLQWKEPGEVDKIYVTPRDLPLPDRENLTKYQDAQIDYVYFRSEKNKLYYNRDIEQYRNIHNGRRCFIVATGPSLRSEDLDTLKQNGELCISFNSIYKMYENTDWRPNYYVTSDYRVMRDEEIALEYMTDGVSFIADNYEPFRRKAHNDNILLYHIGQIWSSDKELPFSEDFSVIAYSAGTVLYVALQLAVYMGIREIYLLGTDLSVNTVNYANYHHFYQEDQLDGVFYGNQLANSYLSAKNYADCHGIHIYNASRGGELEVFERVDFSSLFS